MAKGVIWYEVRQYMSNIPGFNREAYEGYTLAAYSKDLIEAERKYDNYIGSQYAGTLQDACKRYPALNTKENVYVHTLLVCCKVSDHGKGYVEFDYVKCIKAKCNIW